MSMFLLGSDRKLCNFLEKNSTSTLESRLNIYYVKTESKILLGVENNVKLDLWSRQLMSSQSTKRKKRWHSRLICGWCCALVALLFSQ